MYIYIYLNIYKIYIYILLEREREMTLLVIHLDGFNRLRQPFKKTSQVTTLETKNLEVPTSTKPRTELGRAGFFEDTPRKINMQHNHGGLEDQFPF